MRVTLVLSLMAAALAGGLASAQPRATIEDAAWLAGCWALAHASGSTEEHWLPPAGGAMLGLSRTIVGGKMTEFEYLGIREVDGKLSYVAIPSRQRETVFPLVRFGPNELVFENPAHDFPQRVIYRKAAKGIVARIEGVISGKLQSRDYPFDRCK